MNNESIGYGFIAFGVIWFFVSVIAGGMTEYKTTWRDWPWQIVFAIPILLLGAAIVWR